MIDAELQDMADRMEAKNSPTRKFSNIESVNMNIQARKAQGK